MSANEFRNIEDGAHLVFEFGIVPLCMVLWYIFRALNDLKVLLYKEFVTKEDLHNAIIQAKENFAAGKSSAQSL